MSLPSDRPRVIFDCHIFVQAVAFDNGPAAECLRLVETGHIELLVSRSTLQELRRVLAYEDVVAISPNMTPARIGALVKRVTFRATLVRRTPHVLDYPRDPADEPYIDLAVASAADYLVTRDRDLLSLMSGHSPICKQFRRKTRRLRVIDPVSFLKIIAASQLP